MSKAVFREHFEQIWNKKDASAIGRFIAPNYRGFESAELISGIEGYKQHFRTITAGFPDLRLTIEVILDEAIQEGEARVAARWFMQATNTGKFGDIPPTGRRVRMTGIAIVRISDGLIVEEHANSDALGLLKQMGAIPGPVTVPPLFF